GGSGDGVIGSRLAGSRRRPRSPLCVEVLGVWVAGAESTKPRGRATPGLRRLSPGHPDRGFDGAIGGLSMETVIKHEQFTFHFPDEWDERAEWEMNARGCLSYSSVELPDGRRFEVDFYDPVRLRQELELGIPRGYPCIAERGMIVVPEVTREAILAAVDYLVR